MGLINVNKGVSVVVCCYNSASRLSKTLEHLFAQKVKEGIRWEVLIIDNASTDETAAVARAVYVKSRSGIPFRIIDEKRPGLNYARLAGLQESKYEYMIWVDDDNWLQSDYINIAYEAMERNPEVGVLGGIGLPVLEVDPPLWFEKYHLTYAIGKQADQTGEIKNYGFLYGAGAVIRKSAWLAVIDGGFKSILTDRKGSALFCGGDVELENAMRLANYKIWYDESLVFKHFIPKERLTWSFILRSTKGSGESDISAAVFYFIFRNSGLHLSRFKYLYYKRIVWLFLQILKTPKSYFQFLFNKYNARDWGVIEVNRNVANLVSSFKSRETALSAFHNITRYKEYMNSHLETGSKQVDNCL